MRFRVGDRVRVMDGWQRGAYGTVVGPAGGLGSDEPSVTIAIGPVLGLIHESQLVHVLQPKNVSAEVGWAQPGDFGLWHFYDRGLSLCGIGTHDGPVRREALGLTCSGCADRFHAAQGQPVHKHRPATSLPGLSRRHAPFEPEPIDRGLSEGRRYRCRCGAEV